MQMETVQWDDIDVLVIGGGIAAAMAAIKSQEAGARRVVIVDKGAVGKTGNSAFAAGVMHVYVPEEDDLDDRVRRLTRSLEYLAQQDLIRDHLEDSPRIVEELTRYGVVFVPDEKGQIKRVAGRGKYPVMTFFSTQLMDALRHYIQSQGIVEVNRVMLTDLLTANGQSVGAVGFDTRTGAFHVFRARSTVLATGSTWYKGICPGQRDTTGDGFGMAYRAGVELSGSECVDMVANAMPARVDVGPGMNKWVGEGGFFINALGERFLESYNPALKDRSGLRLITAFFAIEARLGHTPIFMDMRHLDKGSMAHLYEVLPLPMRQFESVGIVHRNQFTQPIEWSSCAPVGRPGIFVKRDLSSSLPGMFAGGEVCAPQAVVTGLAAAATSGARAGTAAAQFAAETPDYEPVAEQVETLQQRVYAPLARPAGVEPDHIISKIQKCVIPYDVLLLRQESRLQKALKSVEEIRCVDIHLAKAYDSHYLRMVHEADNLALTAELHLESALQRKESRVAIREDYPYVDNDQWLKWLIVQEQDGRRVWSTRDVPISEYSLKPEPGRKLAYPWQRALELGLISVKEDGGVIWA